MTNEELADALYAIPVLRDSEDRKTLNEAAARLRAQDGTGVMLPDSRLRSMIAGAFRYGAERERAGEIKGSESSYMESEHHANRLVDEFIEAGHVVLGAQDSGERIGWAFADEFHDPDEPYIYVFRSPTHPFLTEKIAGGDPLAVVRVRVILDTEEPPK